MFNEKMKSVMKKSLYILAALAALSFVSCEKEQEKKLEPIVEPAGTTLRASVNDGVDTKVSANPVGVFAWQASDKIAVLDDNGDAHVFTASGSGASTEFTCASSITLGAYAQYPYSASFVGVGDDLEFQIPASIAYSADATNMPMLGKISGDAATFKAVGGLLKLIVYGVPAGASQLEFAAKNKKISGGFEIADASVAEPVIVTAAKGSGDNLITIDFDGNRTDNMVFYIPLPTGTIDGFDLTFNDTGRTSISSSKSLTIARNDIIVAPAINMVTPETLLSETFGTQSGENTYSLDDYNNSGTTVYGGNTITYSKTGTVTLYTTKNEGGLSIANSPKTNELLIGSSTGVLTISDIPTAGASNATISFQSNKNTTTSYGVSSSTEGVTVQTLTTSQISGSSNPYTVLLNISGLSGKSKFSLSISNTSSSNTRVDNIIIRTSAPSPTITFKGNGTRSIAAGSLTATDVTEVALAGAVDGTGIGVSTNMAWLTASLTGSTLSIAATEYYHGETSREGKVFLKATGATTQEITVTQAPSIVLSPTLAKTAGDKEFTVSWAPDVKAGSYVAYYSTTDNMADPTQGTSLVINTATTPYTVNATGLINDTNYYVYVKVASVNGEYSDKYTPSATWSKIGVTPVAGGAGGAYTVISSKASLTAGTYLMGSNNNNTFAGSTTIYLWNGSVSSNKLSKASDKTWDIDDLDFSNTTDAASVVLESAGTANVWRIKVGTKYLAASGTTFALQDDTFDWTFEDLTGTKDGMYFYNTTTTTYVSSNATGDVARAYNADNKVYKGIHFFKAN